MHQHNQVFWVRYDSSVGAYQIRPLHATNKCIDIPASDYQTFLQNNHDLIQYCHGNYNQRWDMVWSG